MDNHIIDEPCCVADEPLKTDDGKDAGTARKKTGPVNQETAIAVTNGETVSPDEGTARKVLPESVVPTICISPSTEEYFDEKTPVEADALSKSKPVQPIEDKLPVRPEGADEDAVLDCIIVPTRKQLAGSLFSGARRLLGFSGNNARRAEEEFEGEACDLESGNCGKPGQGGK